MDVRLRPHGRPRFTVRGWWLIVTPLIALVTAVAVITPVSVAAQTSDFNKSLTSESGVSTSRQTSVPDGATTYPYPGVVAVTSAAPPPAPAIVPPPSPPTPAPTSSSPVDPSQPAPPGLSPQEVGALALNRLDYPYQRLGYDIAFLPPRSGFLGMTYCATHRIEVYVGQDEPVGLVSFVTAFEIAHAVDCTFNTPASRAQWASIRGFNPGVTWFPPCTCSEDNYGSGDFSDVFATWLAGPQWWKWRSNLAPPPTPDQLNRLMAELEPAPLLA